MIRATLLVLSAAIPFFMGDAHADSKNLCSDAFSFQFEEGELIALQNEDYVSCNTLINQYDRRAPEGRGHCGPSSVVNLYQGIRYSFRIGLDSRPYDVMADLFRNFPKLKLGEGSTPLAIFEQTKYIIRTHLPKESLLLGLDIIDLEGEPKTTRPGVRYVGSFSKARLQPKTNELRIMMLVMINPNGTNLGGHAVLLRSSDANVVYVIDPTAPRQSVAFDAKDYSGPIFNSEITESVELVPYDPNYLKNMGFASGTKIILYSLLTVSP